MTAPAVLSAEDLRIAIHRHLRRYPGLTGFEISRAFGEKHLSGNNRVRRVLAAMERDGEAERIPGRKADGDSRTVTRWRAT